MIMKRGNCKMPMKIPYTVDEIATWKASTNDILKVMDMFGVLDHSKLNLQNPQYSSIGFVEGNLQNSNRVRYEIDVPEYDIKNAGTNYEYKNTIGSHTYQSNLKISEAA